MLSNKKFIFIQNLFYNYKRFKSIYNKQFYSKIYNPLINFKIPHFLDIQRDSFKYFLKIGLINEFKNLKKITNSNKSIEIIFYIDKYKLTRPKWTIRQAIFKRKNYSCQLFVPLQIINHNTKESIIDWLLLMNLPLMTKNGHFIINGSPKIIMNQIIRSPGIYFQKLIKQDQQIFYSADLIAERGTWLRLEIDSKNFEIWAKMKKTSKIPINIFLRCLGINLPIFNSYLKLYKTNFNIEYNTIKLLMNKKTTISILSKKNFFLNTKENINFNNLHNNFDQLSKKVLFKSKLENRNINVKEIGTKFLYEKFLNPRLYNLSKLGRLRINKKLGINIPTKYTLLTAKDILFSCFYLIQCVKGIEIPTDIDDLKNRQVRSSGQLIQIQLAGSILQFEKLVRDKLILNEKLNKPKTFIFGYNYLNNGFFINKYIPNNLLLIKKDKQILIKNNYYINKNVNLNNFYNLKKLNSSNLIKFNFYNKKNIVSLSSFVLNLETKIFKFKNKKNLDLNLEIIINSKLFNNFLRDFFNTNPLVQLLDQTNPLAEITHKRRLSSLGPGGISRDTAGMAIRGIHPTHYGRICPIETPEGQNAGLVNSFTIYSHLNFKGFIETPFYKIYKGFIQINLGLCLLSSDQEKNFHIAPGDIQKNILNFLPNKVDIPCRQLKEFKRISRNKMNYIAINPIQMISIATSLIPFLEHNDGNRALMGSNMQRQAVPILQANFPIVGTGLESNIIANSNYGIQAKYSGLVTYIDGKQIIISSSKNYIINPLLKPLYKFKTLYSFSFNKNINKNNKHNKNNLNKLYNYNNINNRRIKIKNNLFNFNKFIYLDSLLNIKNQANTLKKGSLFLLFSLISKKNSSIVSFIFCKKKIKNKLFENNIKHKKYFKLNNFSLINTKRIYKIFNFYFENSSLYSFEIINFYSSKTVYDKKISKIKKFISQNNLFLLKQFKNNNIIKYYSKLIINKSPLINYLIINILNNIKQNKKNKYLKKLKPYKIILPIYFNSLLNKINLSYNIKNIINKTHKLNTNEFKNLNYTKNFDFKFINFHSLKKSNFIVKKQNYKKQLINIKYNCDPYFRSNQDTYLVHRPIVKTGQWIQRGDILADNSTSIQGELSIGQNILIGYLPWEGYNFEDAVLINQRLVYDDIFTSLHIERYETEIRETQFGPEEITAKPNDKILNFLDNNGIIKLGTWVKEGDILVGKTSPIGKRQLSAYEKLLFDIIGKSIPTKKDTSLQVPLGIKGRVIHIEIIEKELSSNLNTKIVTNLNKKTKINKNFFIYKFLKTNNFNIKDKNLKIQKFNLYFTKKLYLINKKNKLQNDFYLRNFNNLYYKKKNFFNLSFNIKNFLIKKKKIIIYILEKEKKYYYCLFLLS